MSGNKPALRIQRNPSIEMLRVFLMLGICVLHAVSHGGNRVPWMGNGLRWCVNGFVFISGWYGIKFLPSKVLRLVTLSLGAGFISLTVACMLGVRDPSSPDFLKAAYCLLTGHWFLSAYILLMLVSPILNCCLDQIKTTERFATWAMPILMLAGWSWLSVIPFVGPIVPSTPGLGDYTGLSLIVTYLTAGVLRRVGVESCHVKCLWLAILCAAPFCLLGLGGYASPFAILMAASVFLLVNKIRLPSALARIFTFAAPSMFAVLLISQKAGFTLRYIIFFEDKLIDSWGLNAIVACILVGGGMFLISFALDMVRRIVVFCVASPMCAICRAIDRVYCRFIDNLAEKLESVGG